MFKSVQVQATGFLLSLFYASVLKMQLAKRIMDVPTLLTFFHNVFYLVALLLKSKDCIGKQNR